MVLNKRLAEGGGIPPEPSFVLCKTHSHPTVLVNTQEAVTPHECQHD